MAAKTWVTGEVITADALNALETTADSALSLLVADTQTPTVPTNLAVSVGMIPVWHGGADVLLRSAIVDVSATADTTLTANTVLCTGLALKASQTYAVWFLAADGSLTHNTLAVNDTGKSITLTADQAFKQGTTLMFITENDI